MSSHSEQGSEGAVRSVAVIGAGAMGTPMAQHIRGAGYGLTVCDTRAESLAAFAEAGVRTTSSAADCADCDVVIVLVATPKQLHAVTTGEGGLLAAVRGERRRYLVVASTVAPGDIDAVAQAFAQTPVRVVDAPISGGVVGARRAALTFLCGGAEEDVAALRPLFATMGQAVFRCGPLGSGETTKAINNMIAVSNLMISAEAFRLAKRNGLRLEDLLPALEAGSARNFLTRDAGYVRETFAAWSVDQAGYEAWLDINQKDMGLARALGDPAEPLPALDALRALLGSIGEETLRNWQDIARGDS